MHGVVRDIVITAACLFIVCGAAAGQIDVRVDCSREVGRIRPLHGVNNGPVNYGETIDLSDYYRQLKIPFARLHDSEWPNPDVVDVHAVFPNLSSDPKLRAGYSFSRTDDYIQAIIDTGAGIVYRLGESIEMTRKKYNVPPPADYDRWAGACLGIIRHYNEGWADGFRHGIRYWEIWNEPENRPNMWTGSDEDYYRLYATAAKAIKTEFPALKVGGPSAGYQGSLVEGRMEPSPFLKGFLEYCRDGDLPLDFFSWHTYTNDPYLYVRKARAIRTLLNDYGFSKAEIHLNEWNYLPDNDWTPLSLAAQGLKRKRWFERVGGAPGAAFLTCVLLSLQDSPVDVANYYAGDTNLFGLFDRYGAPRKTFHAMRAFRMLLDTPLRVEAAGAIPGGIAICAGVNPAKTQLTVLVSSFRTEQKNLSLKIDDFGGPDVRWQAYRLDSQRDLEPVRSGDSTTETLRIEDTIDAPCVFLLRATSTR